MIKIKNTFKLAGTKVASNKGKSLFTGCAMSVGVIMILTFLSVISGISSVGEAAFKSNFSSRYYDLIGLTTDCDPKTGCKTANFNEQKFRDDNAKYNIKAINAYQATPSNLESFNLIDIDKYATEKDTTATPDVQNVSLVAIDQNLISDFFFKDSSFEVTDPNVIPVIIPEQLLINGYQYQESPKAIYTSRQDLVNKIQNKTFQLQELTYLSDPTTFNSQNALTQTDNLPVKFKVVGMTGNMSFGGAAFLIPQTAVTQNPALKKIFAKAPSSLLVVELASKADRDAMMMDSIMDSANSGTQYSVWQLTSTYENIHMMIDGLIPLAEFSIGFVLILSCLFIVLILSRVVSDSRREIGVFRAFGAQKGDISKIFLDYIFILNTASFIVSFILAIIICIFISISWGDDIFYSLVNMSTNFDIIKPQFLFLNFPPLYTIIAFLGVQLVGFLAGLAPTISAVRTDPIEALKAE